VPTPLLELVLRHEQDVVTARQRAGQIAALLGFEQSEQTRVATAVSEIVRNAFRYAGPGTVEFGIEGEHAPQLFLVKVTDRGTGIPDLDAVLSGTYESKTGMGIGLVGARRLMDRFTISSSPAGTIVTMGKLLPRRAPFLTARRVQELSRELTARKPAGLVEEVQKQNQELLRALEELSRRQEELVRLNRELEDTNRGVIALYAELDEKADHLRRADQLKSRFLSDMTHEFRTPVNAILALTSLLEEGPSPQPEIAYIRKAGEQLSEIVNDLLDLAKVEAGKTVVRVAPFEVANLFGALRGMLRPLLLNQSVSLVFDEPSGLPVMQTDEGKVSQVLRNFISNALKYTETGEVRVSAALDVDREEVVFSVSDTGIGIAAEDQSRIFEEFSQIEHPLQRRVKGTGLGLPLSKRLAELLGGSLHVESEVGRGARFSARIPVQYRPSAQRKDPFANWARDPDRLPVLVVEDEFESQLLYEKTFKHSRFQIIAARSLEEANAALAKVTPSAIVLDIVLGDGDAWDFLINLRQSPVHGRIPVVIVSTLADIQKGLALGADACGVKPVDRAWLLSTLETLTGAVRSLCRVLVIEDQPAMRHVLTQLLDPARHVIEEAATGVAGLASARRVAPDLILLDLGLPDMSGAAVLSELKSDPDTRHVPVVIVTGSRLEGHALETIRAACADIVNKDTLTRARISEALRRCVPA
jgi:signal transduction histidine kinase/DNA-binding response OmpR family regulator